MSRAIEDIITSMTGAINLVDPTIDVSKGPVLESSLLPWAKEFATNEQEVEHLGELYQLEKAGLWEENEITWLGRQYGIQYGLGEKSQGYLTFYSVEAPSSNCIIPSGALASTDDAQYVFQTVESGTMYANSSSAYYNSDTRRYEITVAAQAVEPGPNYDVKKGRIRTLMSGISGVSGVINGDDFSGGTVEQSIQEFVTTIRNLPLGNSLGSPGGLKTVLLHAASGSIGDIAVVTPADIGVYERMSETGMRAAVDLYIIGTRMGIDYYSYTIVGAMEKEVYLPNRPVMAVSSVLVDGTAVAYSLVNDTNPVTRGTTGAYDKVVMETAPGVGANVYISYTYNKLVTDLQQTVLSVGSNLFSTSVSVRQGKKVRTVVDFTVSPLTTGVQASDVEEFVIDWFKDPSLSTTNQQFIGLAMPEDFVSAMATILGIGVDKFHQFNRPDLAAAPVQAISYEKTEYPDLLVTLRT